MRLMWIWTRRESHTQEVTIRVTQTAAGNKRIPEGHLIPGYPSIRKNTGASWLPHVPFSSTGGCSALDGAALAGVQAAAQTQWPYCGSVGKGPRGNPSPFEPVFSPSTGRAWAPVLRQKNSDFVFNVQHFIILDLGFIDFSMCHLSTRGRTRIGLSLCPQHLNITYT